MSIAARAKDFSTLRGFLMPVSAQCAIRFDRPFPGQIVGHEKRCHLENLLVTDVT